MEVIERTDLMQQKAEELRMAGKVLGFVPTMGFFHEGHLELMRVARKHCDVVIISIFVNPMQFGPKEDLTAYPRDLEGDLAKARQVGVDIGFVPTVDQVYPEGFESRVSVEKVTKHLCGLSRPTHFDGVTTIVAKLFNITKPHVAVFGQKDYQQLTVISRMVRDLNMDLQILGVPTYREPDGLAMSSRNSYLNAEERKSALCLKKSMDLARQMVGEGETRSGTIKKAIEELVRSHPYTQIDYVSLCDPVTLDDVDALTDETLLALAVKVGKTRLIDNCVLGKHEKR
jgi:pantoate--beta-alanine ligase